MGSALSFYFVYDFCLGPQFPALLVYFLRFIPILILLAIGIIITTVRFAIAELIIIVLYLTLPNSMNAYICRQYKKMQTPFPGVWLVLLLQSTLTIHTSMAVLNCPTIHTVHENSKMVSRRVVADSSLTPIFLPN